VRVLGGVGERLAGKKVRGALDAIGETVVQGDVEPRRERRPAAQLVERRG
jgi:hypothetical protein